MRTYTFLKISISTFFIALSVPQASSVEDDVVSRIAHPKTNAALLREKNSNLQQFAQDRTELVLALNRAIGADFETAVREALGPAYPTDGLTQKQMIDILNQVTAVRKDRNQQVERAQAGATIVRAALGPLTISQLTVQNNLFILNPRGHGFALLPPSPHQTDLAYPGGIPNYPANKENADDTRRVKGNQRVSWGQYYPVEQDD